MLYALHSKVVCASIHMRRSEAVCRRKSYCAPVYVLALFPAHNYITMEGSVIHPIEALPINSCYLWQQSVYSVVALAKSESILKSHKVDCILNTLLPNYI